jgi:hypothetical protein
MLFSGITLLVKYKVLRLYSQDLPVDCSNVLAVYIVISWWCLKNTMSTILLLHCHFLTLVMLQNYIEVYTHSAACATPVLDHGDAQELLRSLHPWWCPCYTIYELSWCLGNTISAIMYLHYHFLTAAMLKNYLELYANGTAHATPFMCHGDALRIPWQLSCPCTTISWLQWCSRIT